MVIAERDVTKVKLTSRPGYVVQLFNNFSNGHRRTGAQVDRTQSLSTFSHGPNGTGRIVDEQIVPQLGTECQCRGFVEKELRCHVADHPIGRVSGTVGREHSNPAKFHVHLCRENRSGQEG